MKTKTATQMALPHLTSIKDLTKDNILTLFQEAAHYLQHFVSKKAIADIARGHVIAGLFFEPSTRTQNAFAIATRRLGAEWLEPNLTNTALRKGETLTDMLKNLTEIGVDLFVIRHPDNHIAHFLSEELHTAAAIINAGDGCNEHPTQCLIDLFTIHQHKKEFENLKVAIIGDLLHSRVARSLCQGLITMGCQNIHLVCPESLTPNTELMPSHHIHHDIHSGITDADVVMTLRIQKERMLASHIPDENTYFSHYGITEERLMSAKPDAIVMHPGPINRGVEISSQVADGPQSVILQQVHNGTAVRMAVIATCLSYKKLL